METVIFFFFFLWNSASQGVLHSTWFKRDNVLTGREDDVGHLKWFQSNVPVWFRTQDQDVITARWFFWPDVSEWSASRFLRLRDPKPVGTRFGTISRTTSHHQTPHCSTRPLYWSQCGLGNDFLCSGWFFPKEDLSEFHCIGLSVPQVRICGEPNNIAVL